MDQGNLISNFYYKSDFFFFFKGNKITTRVEINRKMGERISILFFDLEIKSNIEFTKFNENTITEDKGFYSFIFI